MGIFSSIFGNQNNIEFIKTINKELYEEISFFLDMENRCKEKLRLANEFAFTYDAGDFKALNKMISKQIDLAKVENKLINRFKGRIKCLDDDLASVFQSLKDASDVDKVKLNSDIKQLRKILNLEENLLSLQLKFFEETEGKILFIKKRLPELLTLIKKEAEIILSEKSLLAELNQNIKLINPQNINTAEALGSKLMGFIVDSEALKRVYACERKKIELETCIMEGDSVSKKFEELVQSIITDTVQPELFMRLAKLKPRLERLNKILIKKKDSLNMSEEDYRVLTSFLALIVNKIDIISNIINSQFEALRKKNIDLFMKSYQLEKIFFHSFFDLLVRHKIRLDSTSIKAGFFENYDQDQIQLVGLGTIFMKSFISILDVFHSILGRFNSIKYERLLKNSKPDSILAKKVDDLVTAYGIPILGNFSSNSLETLNAALSIFNKEEMKRSVKQIIFLDEDYLSSKGLVAGFTPYTHILLISNNISLSAIFHELTHARTSTLPMFFMTNWMARFRKNKSMKDNTQVYDTHSLMGIFLQKESAYWKDSSFQASFGYASAYGAYSEEEDIATYMQMMLNISEGKDPFRIVSKTDLDTLNKYVVPYYEVYKTKADILLTFGFINKELHKKFMKLISKIKEPIKY